MFWIGLLVGALATLALAGVLYARLVNRTPDERDLPEPLERLAEIGAMTGGLAHEIKNPLSTIGLNAQLLQEAVDELDVEPEQARRLARRAATLRREVDRLSGILDDFLRYAGELQLDRSETDLRDLVTELADFFLPQAAQVGARIETDLPADPVTARVDASYIKQALLNLLLNASHALASHPPVGDAPRITMGASQSDGQSILTVSDNGPGIPAGEIDRIFAPYFTTRPGGAGLGLPITRRIVEAHDGAISVQSTPGRGAVFTVSLPLSTAARATDP